MSIDYSTLLGEGFFGKVYLANLDNKEVAVKIIRNYNKNNLAKEISFAKLAGLQKIGPEIYLIQKDLIFTYIFMEKFDGNLDSFDGIFDKSNVQILVKKFHKLGYSHNDLSSNNILYRIVDGNIIWRLCDFGYASKYPGRNSDLERLDKI